MMAKAKKKQELTPEEKLKQALVPESEQPYPVPKNWVWVRLETLLLDIRNGTTIKQNKTVNAYPVTRIESLQNNTIDFDRLGYIEAVNMIKDIDWYKENDIALSHINSIEHVGKTALIKPSFPNLIHGMNLLRLRFYLAYIPLLFQYFSQSFQYKAEIISRINMAVNQVSINQKQLGMLPIPLPPLPEQQRIVARIESLFEKLDHARELVQTALDSFETRKAAILHKAFTGELTAKWRDDNGVGMDSWEEKPLEELCDSFQYGTSKKSEQSGEVVVLRMGNLQNGEINWSDLVYTNDEDDKRKYLLKAGDVLFNRTNSSELVGKTSIYRGEIPAIFAGYLIRINYRNCLDGYYLNYALNTQKARGYCSSVKSDGVNQSNINAKKIAAFSIPYCILNEQQEIVCILDNLLEKEQIIKDKLELLLDQIDLVKKSILARAFRGELGTNDPSEESAEEFLKEVLWCVLSS